MTDKNDETVREGTLLEWIGDIGEGEQENSLGIVIEKSAHGAFFVYWSDIGIGMKEWTTRKIALRILNKHMKILVR